MRTPSNDPRTSTPNLSTPISAQDITGTLERVLGRQLLAAILNKSVRSLQDWFADESVPSAEDERRLGNAYKVYALLTTAEGDDTIRAWFMGMNSQLEDASPAESLADDQVRSVMIAARAFVAGA